MARDIIMEDSRAISNRLLEEEDSDEASGL